MKHIFVINPKSGKKDSTKEILKFLENNHANLNFEIYITKGRKDAIEYVRTVCMKKEEKIRFYACGGDGTLNEVVNGAIDYSDVEVTSYPCGSGNDFIKSFPDSELFFNLSNLINGKSIPIDLIKVNDRYTINMCNIGFDASVAFNMQRLRKWLPFKGHLTYNVALIFSLLFKIKHKCKIKVDGNEIFNGKMLLSALGNGVCCGGGYYCLPEARIDDNIIDIVLVKTVSRFNFIKMVKNYKNGSYINIPKYKKFTFNKKITDFELIAEKNIHYCLDGECEKTKNLKATIVSKALNFIIPSK